MMAAANIPLISVVVPTYQRNDLLAKCLTPLTPGAQTLSADRYEVIVTDDCRTGTAEQMIRDQFPWAKWVEGPHRGPASNRNNGAKHAKGEWIVFVDDDCVPKPEWLAGYTGAIRKGCEVYEGKTVCEDWINSPLWEAPVNETGGALWSCNMMIARNLFEELGGFDEGFPFPAMEDMDLCARIRAAKHPMTFVPDAVVNHPLRPANIGRKLGRMRESNVYFLAKRGVRAKFWRDLMRPIGVGYLKRIARSRAPLHVPLAVGKVIAELATIAWMYPGWIRKHPPRRLS